MKAVTIVLSGFLLISEKCFASAGYAYDGLMFILIFCSILMVIAGLLYSIDYISKNRRMLFDKSKSMILKIIRKIKDLNLHRDKYIGFPHPSTL
jgi:hypothetical protein